MRLRKIPMETLKEMESKGFYELMPYTHKNPLVRWIFWKRLESMLNMAPRGKRVLDFGSGSGVLLPSLSKNFEEVFAQDLEIGALEYVRNKYNLENVKIVKANEGVKEGDKRVTVNRVELPYEDNFFDIVFAADVLEHFSDPEQIQKEFRRVLKKDGYLIVSGPTENLIYKISRRLIFWYWKKKEDHFLTVDDLMKISEKVFSVDRRKSLPNSLITGFKVYRARNENGK